MADGSLGNILAGFSEAAHQHNLIQLQMQREQNESIANMFAKLAESPNLLPEQSSALVQESLKAHMTPLGKPYKGAYDPKSNTINLPVTFLHPTPPPISAPGQPPQAGGQPVETGPTAGMVSAGTPESAGEAPLPAASIAPQTIQPPTPPPTTIQATQPISFETRLGREAQTGRVRAQIAGESAEATRRAQLEYDLELDRRRRAQRLSEADAIGGMTPVQKAQYAQGTGTIASRPFPFPSAMKGDAVGEMFRAAGQPDVDITTGKPHDPNTWYNVRHTGAELVSSPEAPKYGAPRWAITQDNRWVQVQEDQHGTPKIVQDLGLTPPQGVPTQELINAPHIIQQTNGDLKLQYLPEQIQRTRGLPGAPQPPPPSTAPAPPGPSGNTPAQSVAPGGGVAPPAPPPRNVPRGTTPRSGDIVGGRSFSPEQIMANKQKGGAYINTAERENEVLDGIEDPKFNFKSVLERAKLSIISKPDGAFGIIAANTANMSQREKDFVAAYTSLGEDINILRQIYGVGVSRGPQALQILLDQRGQWLGNPDVFKGVLTNTLQSTIGQLAPIQSELAKHGESLEYRDAIRSAYARLNGFDAAKTKAALQRDKWIK